MPDLREVHPNLERLESDQEPREKILPICIYLEYQINVQQDKQTENRKISHLRNSSTVFTTRFLTSFVTTKPWEQR